MDIKSIIKYEKLLWRIEDRLDTKDLGELKEFVSLLVRSKKIETAIAVLRLAVFYQSDSPELWTQFGDVLALGSRAEESSRAHKEAARLLRNQLFVGVDRIEDEPSMAFASYLPEQRAAVNV